MIRDPVGMELVKTAAELRRLLEAVGGSDHLRSVMFHHARACIAWARERGVGTEDFERAVREAT